MDGMKYLATVTDLTNCMRLIVQSVKDVSNIPGTFSLIIPNPFMQLTGTSRLPLESGSVCM